MGRPRRSRDDIERRLFEISIGPIRLLDTVLEKAGQREPAALLREVLLDWRAYPSKSVYSNEHLRLFASNLEKIESALHQVKDEKAALLVAEIRRELDQWTHPK
jgi:hypothetical protein